MQDPRHCSAADCLTLASIGIGFPHREGSTPVQVVYGRSRRRLPGPTRTTGSSADASDCCLLLALASLRPPESPDTIRIVIPYAPVVHSDPLARHPRQRARKIPPGDAIVVENMARRRHRRMNTVAKAPADGRTVSVQAHPAHRHQPWLQQTPYDVTKAFEPIALVGSVKRR